MSEAEGHAMEMLFRAKWNIPQATEAMGMTATEGDWQVVMDRFRDYCRQRPIEYRFADDE